MPHTPSDSHESTIDWYERVPVDLKNRCWAAILAWLWPGAGHLYQRRTGKGILFMTCILGIYFWGLAMGEGQVVYASFPSASGGFFRSLRSPEMRYPFLLQIGVGGPSLPAVVQGLLAKNNLPPLFGSTFMAPPRGQLAEQVHDELAVRHEMLKGYFELGTLYTMIAGILNFFAIYDAYYGPAFPVRPKPQFAESGSPP